MEIIILLLAVPIALLFAYVVICAVAYTYGEITCSIRRLKRAIRDTIWEIEWQWKLFRKDFERWTTR